MNSRPAFTLIELLVVIAIVAVLSTLTTLVVASVHLARDQASAMSNFRQLGSGLLTYIAMNNGELPNEGESSPSWDSSADPESAQAWYNCIPRLSGGPSVADYITRKDSFYSRRNLLFVPAAKYPSNKDERPLFAVSYNSKLRRKGQKVAFLAAMENPTRTVVFQESGLPGEAPLPGQSSDKYDGQSRSYASRTVARYNQRALLLFADGHAALLDAKSVVAPDGLGYFPQLGPKGGQVFWTMDPESDPND